MRQPANTVYSFGDFRLDPSERLLLRNGEALPLTPKVFEALVLLVENAGHLVEKEEFMKRLWPDTFVGDDTLAQNISLLRKVLSGNDGASEWIVTIPRRGYRFSAVVRETVETHQDRQDGNSKQATIGAPSKGHASAAARINSSRTIDTDQTKIVSQSTDQTQSALARLFLSRFRLIAAAVIIGTLAGISTYAFLSPPAVPTVLRTTQITHSGSVDPWGGMLSDGSRLYFLEREGDHWNVTQTSLAGGETQIVPSPFRNTLLLDLSPDHSHFLISSFAQRDMEMPLWDWPVQGGSPTRIGDLTAYSAAWHPNGHQIVYSKGDGVYLADRDGSNARRFTAANIGSWRLVWSPEGRALRFYSIPSGASGSAIWEIHSDGTNLRQILPHWSNPKLECCGSWSPDGSYYFFGSAHSGSLDVWGFQEEAGFLRKRPTEPFRLTTGPTQYNGPLVMSADGRRLYVFGSNLKMELVSYSQRSRQFTPFVPGSRAEFSNYSRDGRQIAYSTMDGILWGMNQDGTARRALTAPPIRATHPAWSPDARLIAFVNHSPKCENKVYVVSAEGGTPPQELFPKECEQFDPAWSPDGKFFGFAHARLLPTGRFASSSIELLDLATNQVSTLSGSQGMRAPSWSPDGRYIAAMTEDYHKLMLFDVASEKWTELSQGTSIAGFLRWSHDGTFLYFQDLLAPNETVYRIRMRDRKREEVTNFVTFIRSGVPRCGFIDLGPDDSLVVTLLRNHADIYALDLFLP